MHHNPPDHPPGFERTERQHERQEHRRYLRELREEKARDHYKGKQNLPLEKLPPVNGLEFPLVETGPLNLSIGVQNEDGLLDKPSARRRYDFHENPQLKGVLMLWVRIKVWWGQ